MDQKEIYISLKETSREYEIDYEIPEGVDFALMHKALTGLLKLLKANMYWEQSERHIKSLEEREKYINNIRKRDKPDAAFSQYYKAKNAFEHTIGKMQQDLLNYANTGKANQKAIDIRNENINQIIAYYQEAEYQISDIDMYYMQAERRLKEMSSIAQKLVYWCQIHGVNVHQPQLYTIQELEGLIFRGRKFRIKYEEKEYPYTSIEAILSKEYEDYTADFEKYFDTLFHADTKFRYLTEAQIQACR